MRWTREQVVEHLSPPPGISMPPYPKQRDQLYRWTLAALAVGISTEAAARLAGGELLAMGAQGWTAAAVTVASFSFLVWLTSWRRLVRILALLGMALWIVWPLGGWACTLGAASIMAAKESHCFHFPAGRIIPWYSLALGLALIGWGVRTAVLGWAWAGLAFLWWWMAWDRRTLPLFEI